MSELGYSTGSDEPGDELEAAASEVADLRREVEELAGSVSALVEELGVEARTADAALSALAGERQRRLALEARAADLALAREGLGRRVHELVLAHDEAVTRLRALEVERTGTAAALQRALDRTLPPGTLRRRAYRSVVQRLGASPAGGERPALPLLPPVTSPLVSIIVPVYGELDVTGRCLHALARTITTHAAEVVVVDDASPDATGAVLEHVPNLRVLRLADNVGYLRAVNHALAVVDSPWVVLLNNDTEPEPGWLDAMLELALSDPSIGIVGAKLVYPDGRLQEAGSIVWSDGTGWNYGRHDDPDRPEYCFVRDVDYVSAAAMLVRRSLLDAAGGLDERFAPAYYEDTDLCFTARSLGYRVVFQPEARVVHREGATHGTDESRGVKRHMLRNRVTFVDKWADVLARHHPPAIPAPVLLARENRPGPRVLVVDAELPRPDHDSGSVRMTAILGELRALGCTVTFVPDNGHAPQPYRRRLQQAGVEVLAGDLDVAEVLDGRRPDLVVLSRPDVATAWLGAVREHAPAAKVAYDTVDLHHVREARRAVVGSDAGVQRAADFLRNLELALVRSADVSLVVTDEEKALLAAAAGRGGGPAVAVVPNAHIARAPGPGFDARRGLVFVGGFRHPPNVDAACFLVEEVLPRIRRRLPDTTVSIVGSQPPAAVRELAGSHVHVLGWVEDLAPVYRRARACIAPLRYGAGMKGKVGEALSFGVPVVTTTVGAEGMGLTDGVTALIGDDAAALADHAARLLADPVAWEGLAAAGREHVELNFSTDALRARLADLLASLSLRTCI